MPIQNAGIDPNIVISPINLTSFCFFRIRADLTPNTVPMEVDKKRFVPHKSNVHGIASATKFMIGNPK